MCLFPVTIPASVSVNEAEHRALTFNGLVTASQTVPGQGLGLTGPGAITHRHLGCGHPVVEGSEIRWYARAALCPLASGPDKGFKNI